MTQENPSIGRSDVALMMYQRGLGSLDLALCVDSQGEGRAWERARAMQVILARQGQGHAGNTGHTGPPEPC